MLLCLLMKKKCLILQKSSVFKMIKEALYHDFLLIRQMKATTSKKVRMFSELLAEHPDHWQVIGITEEALKVFANHDFKRVSRMGLNRSHLVDRHKTYTTMIEGPLMDLEEWYRFYRENDLTIIATSSENISGNFSKVYHVDPSLNLFKSSGFSWRHKKDEIEFLKETYQAFGIEND